jgi:ABC-2 type transport system ATP-binding protein
MIRMAFGLLRADEGIVRIHGTLDPVADAVEVRKRVAFAGDDLGIYPNWTVSRVLRFSEQVYPDWNAARAASLRERFRLPIERPFGQLSLGLQARLKLLLVSARDVDVLLLDEPFGGLDVVVRREILEGVFDLIPDGERTVFVTSHLVHELERLVDHVAILKGSGISFAGPLETLRQSVRRVRLAPAETAPDLARWPWVRRAERLGRGWDLTVLDWSEDRADVIRDAGFAVEAVTTLDLEDIAYEYLREDEVPGTVAA